MKTLLLFLLALALPPLQAQTASVAGSIGAMQSTGNANSTTYELYLLDPTGTKVQLMPWTTNFNAQIGTFFFPIGSPTMTDGVFVRNGISSPSGKAGADALLAFYAKIGQ